jgi:hypothetical protein
MAEMRAAKNSKRRVFIPVHEDKPQVCDFSLAFQTGEEIESGVELTRPREGW